MTTNIDPFHGLTSPVLDHGTHHGIDWQVHQGPLSITGYVRLPNGHPWIGEDLLFGKFNIDVHGGISFHRGRTVGFDCNHYMDIPHPDSPRAAAYMEGWTPELGAHLWTLPEVVTEVKHLAKQAAHAMEATR